MNIRGLRLYFSVNVNFKGAESRSHDLVTGIGGCGPSNCPLLLNADEGEIVNRDDFRPRPGGHAFNGVTTSAITVFKNMGVVHLRSIRGRGRNVCVTSDLGVTLG